MKRLFFDIEATRLDAYWGTILCIGYKLGDGKVKVAKITDFPHRDILDDSGLVNWFAQEIYPQADISVGHYSSRYDIPFIDSRLRYHGLPRLPKFTFHIDTWRIAKYQLKLDSNRLARLADFLRVPDRKTSVDPIHWQRAVIGDKKALKYIVEHCHYDILVLEQVYNSLKEGGFVNEPAQYEDGCIACGSHKLQRRGYARTLARRYPRLQCSDCGKWQRGNKTETKLQLVG